MGHEAAQHASGGATTASAVQTAAVGAARRLLGGASFDVALAELGQGVLARRVALYKRPGRDRDACAHVVAALVSQWMHGPAVASDSPGSEAIVPESWAQRLADGSAASARQHVSHLETAVPVLVRGDWWGYLTIEVEREGEWEGVELDAFALVASAIAAQVEFRLGEARTAREADLYQALVERLPCVVYMDSPDEQQSLYISPQVTALLGHPPEAFSRFLWEDSIHPDDAPEIVFTPGATPGRKGDLWAADYRMTTRDGRTIWVHDEAALIRAADGTPLCWQGVVFDVTQRKELQDARLREAELVRKSETIGRRFTALMLSDAPLKRVLETLEEIVDNPVIFENAAHQLIDYAAGSSHLDDMLMAWQKHSREGHRAGNTVGAQTGEHGGTPCAWISIELRDQLWGRLHLLGIDGRIDEMDMVALDRAAAATALTLRSERDPQILSERARGSLVEDIMDGRCRSAGEAVGRLNALGVDLTPRHIAYAVAVSAGTPEETGGVEAPRSTGRDRLLDEVLRCFRVVAKEAGCSAVSAVSGDRVLAIVAIPAGSSAAGRLDAMGAALHDRAAQLPGSVTLTVGASSATSPERLGTALRQAVEVQSYAPVASAAPVRYFDDWRLHSLLAHAGDGPGLALFVESELGPLLAHDASSTAPLIPTLRAFLNNRGRKTVTARLLHLERQSLYARLSRIEQVLGASLDDGELQLRLAVALHGLDVLARSSGKR